MTQRPGPEVAVLPVTGRPLLATDSETGNREPPNVPSGGEASARSTNSGRNGGRALAHGRARGRRVPRIWGCAPPKVPVLRVVPAQSYEPEIITFDELLARAEWHVRADR
ncbi:hypothetical protein HNR02_004019 [Amycolatopsis endophytica]|uniref:Uncharacterized protein n=1 Tax=Amycolatopsis endophytica TaxID=860233 RepID=A0A853B897_9PSEU|nr:hypothetical protein [Amycolatopsis endophytica]